MIQLSDGYFMNVDSHCYTVGIPKKQTIENKKTGECKETTIMTEARYYTTFDRALTGWWQTMRIKALSKFDGSLEEAIEVVKKSDEEFKKIISKIEIAVINSTKLMEVTDESNTNTSDTEPSARNRRGRK
jgi:hypothetical protein